MRSLLPLILFQSHLELLVHLRKLLELNSEILDLQPSIGQLNLRFLVRHLQVLHLTQLDLHFLHDLREARELLHQRLCLRYLEIDGFAAVRREGLAIVEVNFAGRVGCCLRCLGGGCEIVHGSSGAHSLQFTFLGYFALFFEGLPHLLRVPETHFQGVVDLHLDFGSLAVLLFKLVDFAKVILQFIQVGRPEHVFECLYIALSSLLHGPLQRLLFQRLVKASQALIDMLGHLPVPLQLLLLKCVLLLQLFDLDLEVGR